MRGELGKPWIGTLEIEEGSITLTDKHGSDRDIETYFMFMEGIKITEAESAPDCWEITGTALRSPQV